MVPPLAALTGSPLIGRVAAKVPVADR